MYNALTGRNERVGNWAGVTVEKKESPIKKSFYNGAEEQPEQYDLRLSDAFVHKVEKPEIELTCRVYNINYGRNQRLLAQHTHHIDKFFQKNAKTYPTLTRQV